MNPGMNRNQCPLLRDFREFPEAQQGCFLDVSISQMLGPICMKQALKNPPGAA